ncbi:hypothetical protein AB1L42_07580 [Thalassoglobus sp. JC818]|uniref:zinc ribbon domain-containing protein n=1 Tax=Thalassoglobus sp. JC818 TaxID=3232136 RepID=UPI00345824B6
MPPSATDYRRLHDLHKDLKKTQDKLARGPRQIRARQARVEAAQEELTQLEQTLQEVRGLADRKNLDLKSKESHMVELQGKLNAAASNREFDIIRGQIDADVAAKAVLEDEVLEALERVDRTLSEIAEKKEEIAQLETETRDFANDFEQKSAKLREQEVSLGEQIKETEKIVPSEIREQYDRLVEAYGPEAMAQANGGVCNNCFTQLTPQSKVLLNSGKILFCGSCGRLLYQG